MTRLAFDDPVPAARPDRAVVRPIDDAQRREFRRSLGVGVFLVAVLLFSAWQHFELLRHGYEIERLQRERAAEEEVNRHLRLEIEALEEPARIDKIARETLHLVDPSPAETIVIERVVPAAPPDASVVALR
jgi:cell division protein FtsL